MIKNKDDVIQYLTNVANYELAESIKSAKTIEQVIVARMCQYFLDVVFITVS